MLLDDRRQATGQSVHGSTPKTGLEEMNLVLSGGSAVTHNDRTDTQSAIG
jgi:hypothetical protein